MNNKSLGTQFEREFCERLRQMDFWVHFISPSADGSQPFDIIAVKDGTAYAYDCKTSVNKIFPLSRLEDNQIMAFELWMRCGNKVPRIAVKYGDKTYIILYPILKELGKVDLTGGNAICLDL